MLPLHVMKYILREHPIWCTILLTTAAIGLMSLLLSAVMGAKTAYYFASIGGLVVGLGGFLVLGLVKMGDAKKDMESNPQKPANQAYFFW